MLKVFNWVFHRALKEIKERNQQFSEKVRVRMVEREEEFAK